MLIQRSMVLSQIILLVYILIIVINVGYVGANLSSTSTQSSKYEHSGSIKVPGRFGEIAYGEDDRINEDDDEFDEDTDYPISNENTFINRESTTQSTTNSSANSMNESTGTNIGGSETTKTVSTSAGYRNEDGCFCRSDASFHDVSINCKCFGDSVLEIPNNLTKGLTRL